MPSVPLLRPPRLWRKVVAFLALACCFLFSICLVEVSRVKSIEMPAVFPVRFVGWICPVVLSSGLHWNHAVKQGGGITVVSVCSCPTSSRLFDVSRGVPFAALSPRFFVPLFYSLTFGACLLLGGGGQHRTRQETVGRNSYLCVDRVMFETQVGFWRLGVN